MSKWQCQTSKKCIDVTQKCNFHNDCGVNDNSDEQDCGTCDFENNDRADMPITCGWRNLGANKNQWVVKSANELSPKYEGLPRKDGKWNSNGRYLIIDTSRGTYKTK